jgi:D-xylono/L-arabinono-1,4-lactonase
MAADMPVFELLADDGNLVGESPLWDPRSSVLWWVDGPSCRLYQLDPRRREKVSYSLGHPIAGIALHAEGGLLLSGGGFLRHWRGPGDAQVLAHDASWNFNDIVVDPQGRLLAGTAYWRHARMLRPGYLLIFEANGSVRVADEGILMSNGLAFSPDSRALYYTDSAARRIYAYDYDLRTGTPSNRRILVQVSQEEGLPDGLAVATDGSLWSAQWFGQQVVRYSPRGEVIQRYATPVAQVSSVAFGGAKLDELFVTSAADATESDLAPTDYDYARAPRGGQLWRFRAPLAGLAEHPCQLSPAAAS